MESSGLPILGMMQVEHWIQGRSSKRGALPSIMARREHWN